MIIMFLIFVLIAIILYFWFEMIRESKLYNINGPFPLPIIGNANLFMGKPTQNPVFADSQIVNQAIQTRSVLQFKMIILFLIFVLIAIILYFWFEMIRESKLYNINGPFPLPIIGNANLLMGKPTRFLPVLKELSDKYGDALRVHLGSRRFVFITHPKLIEELVSSIDLINKGESYVFLLPWLGQGLLTATGNRWKTHRKFLTPAFHFNILQNFLPLFLKNEKILINKLKRVANGNDLDVFPVISLYSLDNVTESIMGVSFNAQNNSESKYVKAINDLSQIISTRMRNAFMAIDTIFNLTHSKKVQDSALKLLHENTINVINARQSQLKKLNITKMNADAEIGIKNKHAFLDLLLLAEVDGKKIDDESIREEVETFMFEGYDTTTSGIVFCLYCISKYQDVQEKILNEQKSILGDSFRDPTYNELKQMRYLEMVIKESLRLYPSVPMIQRKILKETDLSGLHILKDTSITIDIFHMHRNPDVFDNPLEFKPERFKEHPGRSPFSWIPFSAGPRNCIGQKFAMMELKVTILSIVKNFKLLPSNIEPQLCADLILRSENGVHVKLQPRQVKV